MLEISSDNLIQLITVMGLAVIGTFIAIQKILKDWKSTSAETSIITLMHTELERMSEQNTALSLELGRLHSEIMNLNKELQKLTVENQRLQLEVIALTNEVSLFKELTRKENHGKI